MEEIFDLIFNSGVILDPDFELYLCENKIRVSVNSKGYPKVNINRKSVLIPRMVLNAPKGMEVDHINGDPKDNRAANLRLVTHTQNMWNSKIPSTNKSGIKGVSQDPVSLLFVACIYANNIRYRKKFKSVEEASNWRKQMERELHGRFSRKV